jgi:hypothetical protein
MDTTSPRHRGMTTFAAIGATMIGIWHLVSGIAGVTSDDRVETLNEALFGIDITIFGWFWVVIGAVQLLTAVLIFQRNPWGRVAGMVWAAVSGTMALFVIYQAPIWALVVLGMNVLIIRALAVDTEFGEM